MRKYKVSIYWGSQYSLVEVLGTCVESALNTAKAAYPNGITYRVVG